METPASKILQSATVHPRNPSRAYLLGERGAFAVSRYRSLFRARKEDSGFSPAFVGASLDFDFHVRNVALFSQLVAGDHCLGILMCFPLPLIFD
jgi:hypothetical protein